MSAGTCRDYFQDIPISKVPIVSVVTLKKAKDKEMLQSGHPHRQTAGGLGLAANEPTWAKNIPRLMQRLIESARVANRDRKGASFSTTAVKKKTKGVSPAFRKSRRAGTVHKRSAENEKVAKSHEIEMGNYSNYI